MSDPVAALIARLDARGFDPRSTGPDSWEARCPAHDGSRHNLSVAKGDDGRALVHCHHEPGCPPEAVAQAVGLSLADLFPASPGRDRPSKNGKPKRAYPDLRAAAEALHGHIGATRATWWEYPAADGSPWMGVIRFDLPDDEKTYRPLHVTPAGWVIGDPPGPLPLYRLPELAGAPRVYVGEGEKVADAVRKLRLHATTPAHGAKSPRKTDWSPLAGAEVILLPDHDAPGESYLAAVLRLLAALEPRPRVKVVRLADLWRTDAPIVEGADIEEWLADGVPEGWDGDLCREELERQADAAPVEDLDAVGSVPAETENPIGSGETFPKLQPGRWVKALDRDNFGQVEEDLGDRARIHFVSPQGREATVTLLKSGLCNADGSPLSAPPPPDAPAPLDWPERPSPIRYEMRPVPPLLPEMIPGPFRGWLADIAARVSCPLDFPAVGAIVALAIVVGRRVAIRPKRHDDWSVVPNLWGGIVGRPGVLKSPALNEATKPIRRLEAEARKRHEAARATFETDALVASVKAEAAKKKVKDAAKDNKPREIIDALARELSQVVVPVEPILRRYTTSDPTVEALGELLRDNEDGLGLIRDELTGLLRNLEKAENGSARSFYLESWNGNGTPFTYDRIGRGTIIIPSPCVSILGGIQPGPLRKFLRWVARGEDADDGLISRFQLLVWPDVPNEWRNVDRWPDTAEKNRAFAVFEALDSLAPADLGADPDEDGGSPFLRFAPDAQEVFDEWRAGLESRVRSPDESPLIESHLSKYRSLMPSLALLFHLIEVACGEAAGPVSHRAARLAVEWCDYLEAHARRIYACVSDPELEPARALADRIKAGALPSPFQLRDVYRRCWSNLDTSEAAQRGVAALEDLGWLRTVEGVPTAGRPRTDIHIHPTLPRKEGKKTRESPDPGTDKADESPDLPP